MDDRTFSEEIMALKEHAPIVEYVRNFYPDKIPFVEENSKYASAFCIWHDDNNSPSLVFFKRTNTFKCFGCGKEGDVINLVQNIEYVPFQAACKIIGDNVGYHIEFVPPNPAHEAYKNAMDEHTRRYWNNLKTNTQAFNYLTVERGLTINTITEYRVGVTDIDEYKIRSDIGNISNKIVFPILEAKPRGAKCIGMAYRSLDGTKPKYINDPNQDGREGQLKENIGVFTKGSCLFGYPQAYRKAKEFGHIILVEGYMDVLSLYQSGIKNSVAAMGTQLTEAQACLISKLSENVIIIMDGDEAGRASVIKMLPLLLSKGLNVRVCMLNNGIDPADLCLKYSFDGKKVCDVIKQITLDSSLFLVNELVRDYENISSMERKRALNSAKPFMEKMNPVELAIFKNSFYKRLNIT